MTTLYRQPSLLNRLTAVLGVMLVVLLNILVASPGLHAWVHCHDGLAVGCHANAHTPAGSGDHRPAPAPVGDSDHHCAVTLFAGGVEALPFAGLLLLLLPPVCCAVLRPSDRRVAERPRYWHMPAIGPPVV